MSELIQIRLKWLSIRTDPTPYKVYSPEFYLDCFVQVDIPSEMVLVQEPLTLTLDGVGYIQEELRKIQQKYYEAAIAKQDGNAPEVNYDQWDTEEVA